MTWHHCPWCTATINGDWKFRDHRQSNHPAEYRLFLAQDTVKTRQWQLTGVSKRLAKYDAITAELQSSLPPIATELLQQELRFLSYKSAPDRESLNREMETTRALLREAEKELAEITAGKERRGD